MDPGGILTDPARPGYRFAFEISGNHGNPKGNPLPKKRFTMRQHRFNPAAKEYHEYLDFVRGVFYNSALVGGRINHKQFREFFYGLGPKPLRTEKKKCRMDIFITWGSGNHGDPENVFGAIADALFADDKYLSGGFDFAEEIDPKGGKVAVRIFIPA